jgi:hypothetical protein
MEQGEHSMNQSLIQGNVAEILNIREVALNIGKNHGVTIGMKFKIVDKSHEIKDPNTGEIIGNIDREKIRVKVTEIQDKLSIARTYETFSEGFPSGLYEYLTNTSIVSQSTKVRTLRATDQKAPYDPLEERSSFVKVGDAVIQIPDN